MKTRAADESEIIRKCLARNEKQCSFMEHRNYKLVYRRYASLYFIVGIDEFENELSILEFIHMIVETYDNYFEGVCELDVSSRLLAKRCRIVRIPALCITFLAKPVARFPRVSALICGIR